MPVAIALYTCLYRSSFANIALSPRVSFGGRESTGPGLGNDTVLSALENLLGYTRILLDPPPAWRCSCGRRGWLRDGSWSRFARSIVVHCIISINQLPFFFAIKKYTATQDDNKPPTAPPSIWRCRRNEEQHHKLTSRGVYHTPVLPYSSCSTVPSFDDTAHQTAFDSCRRKRTPSPRSTQKSKGQV